jgi:erythromycin esterase-like protein
MLAELCALLDRRLLYVRRDGASFFDATQNARVVRAAEHYYRLMYRSSKESWNLRDRHMFDTLVRLLAARGSRSHRYEQIALGINDKRMHRMIACDRHAAKNGFRLTGRRYFALLQIVAYDPVVDSWELVGRVLCAHIR